MKLFSIAVIAVGLAISALADDGDDTLRFFLGRSDVVLVGTMVDQPDGPAFREHGVANYGVDVQVEEVLMGVVSTNRISVHIVRFESGDQDKIPSFTKGEKYILLLKAIKRERAVLYTTVDVWIGIQAYRPWMARSLKRLAKEQDKKTP